MISKCFDLQYHFDCPLDFRGRFTFGYVLNTCDTGCQFTIPYSLIGTPAPRHILHGNIETSVFFWRKSRLMKYHHIHEWHDWFDWDTVDGSEILHRGCMKPCKWWEFTISAGAGFQPSTVWLYILYYSKFSRWVAEPPPKFPYAACPKDQQGHWNATRSKYGQTAFGSLGGWKTI